MRMVICGTEPSTVIALMLWATVTYAIFYKDHRLNRWLDSQFK